MFYSDQAYPMFYPQSVMEPLAATRENKDKLFAWLRTVELCSGGALLKAVEIAESLQPHAVYVLSDGDITSSRTLAHAHCRERAQVFDSHAGHGRRQAAGRAESLGDRAGQSRHVPNGAAAAGGGANGEGAADPQQPIWRFVGRSGAATDSLATRGSPRPDIANCRHRCRCCDRLRPLACLRRPSVCRHRPVNRRRPFPVCRRARAG